MSRRPKGSVVIENFQGRLRLRLPAYCPTRYLTLGLADNARNRKVAGHKAAQIEADLIFERFDPSLDKYKNPLQLSVDKTPLLDYSMPRKGGSCFTDIKMGGKQPKNHLATLCGNY